MMKRALVALLFLSLAGASASSQWGELMDELLACQAELVKDRIAQINRVSDEMHAILNGSVVDWPVVGKRAVQELNWTRLQLAACEEKSRAAGWSNVVPLLLLAFLSLLLSAAVRELSRHK